MNNITHKLYSEDEILSQLNDDDCNQVMLANNYNNNTYKSVLSTSILYDKTDNKYIISLYPFVDTHPIVSIKTFRTTYGQLCYSVHVANMIFKIVIRTSDNSVYDCIAMLYENSCTHPIIEGWKFNCGLLVFK